jgi:hypothetical protein
VVKKKASSKPYEVSVVGLDTLKPDPNNINLHTQAGTRMVENSISKRGVARPGFAANDGTVLGGNLSSLEIPGSLGMTEAIVIKTDGSRPIIHMRTDIEPDSEEARLLALEDNEASVASYRRDAAMLAKLASSSEEAREIIPDKVLAEIIGKLILGPDTEDEAPTAPSDYVVFKFGQYSGLVSGDIYARFETKIKAARIQGAAMLDDILKDWL